MFALLGYDAVNILAEGLRRAQSTDGAALISGLEAIKDLEGLTGSLSYSVTEHVPRKAVTVIAMKSGEYTLGATKTAS